MATRARKRPPLPTSGPPNAAGESAQRRKLTVLSDAAADPGTPGPSVLNPSRCVPSLRRFNTPDCMSSPVSYLRDMTHGLEEGARRERAAQFLLESRLAHLQQRRLYLVLDLMTGGDLHYHLSKGGPFGRLRTMNPAKCQKHPPG